MRNAVKRPLVLDCNASFVVLQRRGLALCLCRRS